LKAEFQNPDSGPGDSAASNNEFSDNGLE
jgi:hypothetical protein